MEVTGLCAVTMDSETGWSTTPVHRYARHGRELMGCKSPVSKFGISLKGSQ